MDITLIVEDEAEEPKEGMIFNTIDEVKEYYRRYGNKLGFPVKSRTSTKGNDGECVYVTLACSRAGKATSTSRNIRKRLPSSKTDCKAKLSIAVCPDGRWQVTSFRPDHNHVLNPGTFVKGNLELNDIVDVGVSKSLDYCVVEETGYENVPFWEKDFINYTNKLTRLRLGQGDTSAIQNYFMKMQANNSNFFYTMDLDDEGCLRNVFWADARSRVAYEEFGDVVAFDTTYVTNKYDMPLAPFIGVNHHGQETLLGCALLSGEDTETYTWLFQCWLTCMSGCAPKAIITDQDNAMQKAIDIVFPTTRHRWCLWHIIKKLPEKLRVYDQYESIKFALQNFVYDSLTHDEFEERWNRMIEMYNLHGNDWLLGLYDERHRWVPAYVKDTFWAGLPTTPTIPFFEEYVNSRTTLKQFVEQYENVLRSKVERENQDDFNSLSSPVTCITHYIMEKQFQDAYTTTKFKEFQHELTGKICCEMSSVEKDVTYSEYEISEDSMVGEIERRATFKVSLTHDGCDIQCSCCLFESGGLLCRHAIVVLIHNKILSVPEKYILPRWRKGVKRRHTEVKITYNNWIGKPEACRLDMMCNAFLQIANLSTDSEDKTSIVMDWITKLEKELNRDECISGSSQPTQPTAPLNEGTTTNGNDIPVKSKQSEPEQAVRKKKKHKRRKSRRENTTDSNTLQEPQIKGELAAGMHAGGSNGGLPPPHFTHMNPYYWMVPPNGHPLGGFPPSGLPPGGFPPSGLPPGAFPPSGLPPSGLPPSAFPPSGLPPSSLPPGAFPPSGLPPGAFPPSSLPPSGIPPGAFPPSGLPPSSLPPGAFPPSGLPPSSQPSGGFVPPMFMYGRGYGMHPMFPHMPPGFPSQPASIPTDPADIPTDTADIPTDPAGIATDSARIPADPSSIPTDPANIPTDPASIPADPVSIPTDPAMIPTRRSTRKRKSILPRDLD